MPPWLRWLVVMLCHAILATGMVCFVLVSDDNLFPENEAAPGWFWFCTVFGTILAVPAAALLVMPLLFSLNRPQHLGLTILATFVAASLIWGSVAYRKIYASPSPSRFSLRMFGAPLPAGARCIRVRGPGFGKGTTLCYFECHRAAVMELVHKLRVLEVSPQTEEVGDEPLDLWAPAHWPDCSTWKKRRYFYRGAANGEYVHTLIFDEFSGGVYLESNPFAESN